MRIGLLVLFVSSLVGALCAVTQDVGQLAVATGACTGLSQAVSQVTSGRLKDAEASLSAFMSRNAASAEPSCAWLAPHYMAIALAFSGRLAEAEVFAERSLAILEERFPPGDLVLLRPLQVLASAELEQRKIAKARQALRKMQSIHVESPVDRAIVHGISAALLHAEGRYRDAEPQYLAAVAAWEQAGRGQTAEAAMVLGGLGALYIAAGRYLDAARILDRALAVVASAADAVPTDRIKLLMVRAAVHTRQREWREAEAELRSALSTADHDTRLAPPDLRVLLASYAQALRKNHRKSEARSIESRAAALPANSWTDSVVDTSELAARPKAPGR